MNGLLKSLFSHRDKDKDTENDQNAELMRHIQARQELAKMRLARLEMEANLLTRGQAGSRG